MTLETVTLKLPRKLLSDAGSVACAQDVTIGHLVRQLLAKEVDRRLNPKSRHAAEGGLLAALQALLAKDMAEASDWDDLAQRLYFHGYELRPAGGGAVLHRRACGTRVCKGSELGFGYRSLVLRFGKGMPGHPHGALDIEVRETPAPPPPLNSAAKGRLQRSLEPVFKTSTDWGTLITRLKRRGFVLRPAGTDTVLYTDPGGRFLADTKTVGYRYSALVKKFGSAMPGHPHGAEWIKSPATGDVREDADTPDFDVIDRHWRMQADQNAQVSAATQGASSAPP